MFHEELSHYLHLPTTGDQPDLFVDTINSYESTITALRINGAWFVIAEANDPSRITDLDALIKDEFDAEAIGWCVLKPYQKKLGDTLSFTDGKDHEQELAYRTDHTSWWLLKIQPGPDSRLLRIATVKY